LGAADESLAENEEALEAAGILHGRLGALEHTIGLGDLLVDSWQRIAPRPAAALRGGEILLELHAADLLVARTLGENEAGAAHDPYAAHSEHGNAQAADRPHTRRDHAPKTAMDAHDWFRSPGSHGRIMRG